jgi:hypothetical protein
MEKLATPDVMTSKQAAIYLQLPVETVILQAEQGYLPGRKIENDWRFLKVAIDDWLHSNIPSIFLNSTVALFTPNSIDRSKETRDLSKVYNDIPDRTEQIAKNQKAIEKLRQIMERDKHVQPSPEAEKFFEDFKAIVDEHRPVGKKLFAE